MASDIPLFQAQLFNRLAHPLQNIQIFLCITFDFITVAAHDHDDFKAAVQKVPGNYVTVTTVVSRPAEYTNLWIGSTGKFLFYKFGAAAAGVFHQNHPRYSKLIYRPRIKRPNLIPRHHNTFFTRQILFH